MPAKKSSRSKSAKQSYLKRKTLVKLLGIAGGGVAAGAFLSHKLSNSREQREQRVQEAVKNTAIYKDDLEKINNKLEQPNLTLYEAHMLRKQKDLLTKAIKNYNKYIAENRTWGEYFSSFLP